MTVEAKHKAYLAAQTGWQTVRDFVAGGATVRKYVQTLPGHDTDTAKLGWFATGTGGWTLRMAGIFSR